MFGALQVEIDGFAQGIEFDFLNITGLANLSGVVDVTLDEIFSANILKVDDSFQILLAAGGVTGIFSDINVNLAGIEFQQLIGENDVTLRVIRNDFGQDPQPIPEPGTALLVMSGVLVVWRRRRRA